MTQAFISKDQGYITSIKLIGHAGYDTVGKDIVCAGISVAAHMTVLGLSDVAKAKFTGDVENPGYMEIILHEPCDPNVITLVNTLELTLKDLALQYPQYLQVYAR